MQNNHFLQALKIGYVQICNKYIEIFIYTREMGPFGGLSLALQGWEVYKNTQTDVRTHKQMFGHTDKMFGRTNKHMGQKSRHAKNFFVSAPIWLN